MRISLDKALFERIINYIGTRPLREVIQLWTEINKDMQMIKDEPAKEESTE